MTLIKIGHERKSGTWRKALTRNAYHIKHRKFLHIFVTTLSCIYDLQLISLLAICHESYIFAHFHIKLNNTSFYEYTYLFNSQSTDSNQENIFFITSYIALGSSMDQNQYNILNKWNGITRDQSGHSPLNKFNIILKDCNRLWDGCSFGCWWTGDTSGSFTLAWCDNGVFGQEALRWCFHNASAAETETNAY